MTSIIKSRKSVILISALLIFALAMVGCSSKDDTSAEMIKVKVAISCESLKDVDEELMNKVSDNGVILKETEIEIEKGQNALDALKAVGKDYSETGGMIVEINGLNGGDAGDMSGWLFKHNGEFPPMAAGDLELKNGDKVEFVFSTNGGEDVGLTFE